ESQLKLSAPIFLRLVYFFHRDDSYAFSSKRRPISRERRRFFPSHMKQLRRHGYGTRWHIAVWNAVGHFQVVPPDPPPGQARNAHVNPIPIEVEHFELTSC